MANEIIKAAARDAGVNLWEVALVYGVADTTFSRKLRFEFPETERLKILEIIQRIKTQKERES